ncbi:hypothetical protein [uncultured Mameliella sp.]|uniref:hypothetical protein n=2 Tax=uncultured Mameliella sp. TaxID=1447087 RepID=UPI0026283078|nr:hypothetical protein [uncultured Mameliella sp.]
MFMRDSTVYKRNLTEMQSLADAARIDPEDPVWDAFWARALLRGAPLVAMAYYTAPKDSLLHDEALLYCFRMLLDAVLMHPAGFDGLNVDGNNTQHALSYYSSTHVVELDVSFEEFGINYSFGYEPSEGDWERSRGATFNWQVVGDHSSSLDVENFLFDFKTLLEGGAPTRIFETPLWASESELEPIAKLRALPGSLRDKDIGWNFWARWLDGLLRGEPLDWELQRRVALIPQEVWEAGADAVAEAIAEIEAAYLQEQAPLAERVEFNEDSCRFRVVPIPMQNAAFMSALMSRTADALDDALHGNNGLREDMREVRVLRRTHQRYSNDPQRVEMDYTSVAISLRRNLDAKELADSDDNLALLEAVEDGVRGLRAHHPEVAANRETLAKQAMRELPSDQIALLEDAQDVLPEITEGVMQEDFVRDIPKLINDATLPLPSGAPPLPGADEATRIFSRSAGIKLLYAKACESGSAIFDSKDFKTVRLGLTVSGLLSALITLGLTIFGVL